MAWQLMPVPAGLAGSCFPNPTGNRELLKDQEGEQHGPCTGSKRSEWKGWGLWCRGGRVCMEISKVAAPPALPAPAEGVRQPSDQSLLDLLSQSDMFPPELDPEL